MRCFNCGEPISGRIHYDPTGLAHCCACCSEDTADNRPLANANSIRRAKHEVENCIVYPHLQAMMASV